MTRHYDLKRYLRWAALGLAMTIGRLGDFSPAFAAQSLSLSSSSSGTFAIPNRTPFTSVGTFRWELRLHNVIPASGTDTELFRLNNYIIKILASNQIEISDWNDTLGGTLGHEVRFDLSSRPDCLLRITRDVEGMTFYAEIWNADGTNYVISPKLPITTLGSNNFSGTGYFGKQEWQSASPTAQIAFYRWYSFKVPDGSAPPPSVPAGGDLADWEFEGNGMDSSGNQLNISYTGGIAYTTTPTYPPACNAGVQQTFRAGFPASLDGSKSYPLDNGSTLTYTWQQLSGPTTVFWSGQATARPTVSGLVFGTYKFQLTVTEGSGNSSQCTVTHGAVATDDSGVVTLADPQLAKLFGPMIRYGANPWPWYDERHKALADFFGALQETDYIDYWNKPSTGTVQVTYNSRTVVGAGTSFRRDFCGGGNTPTDESFIVIWYPLPGGGTGRKEYRVAACQDDTHLTLAYDYLASADASGLNYTVDANPCRLGIWIGGSTNVNYYDNVLAFYALYYRSGLEVYRDYARKLADRWWTSPFIDEGRSCSDGDGSTCLAPRLRSVAGLVARALDGRPDMWSGLRKWFDNDRKNIVTSSELYDIREDAYNLASVALCANLDPDETHRAACAADTVTSLTNKWGPQQQPGGYWLNKSYGYASWNGYPGSVTVEHGSSTVTGVGTNWTAAMFPQGYSFWVTNAPSDPKNGDPVVYRASYVSPTTITLDRPYEGQSGSLKGWQSNDDVGYGTQPFMLGIVGTAMRYTYLATGDERARKFAVDIANWVRQYGYRASTKGLYYARYFLNCEPITEGIPYCSSEDTPASRFLSGEVLGAISAAYLYSSSPDIAMMGDILYGAMFGKKGGPFEDQYYVTEIEEGGWTEQTKKAKNFGFMFGFGMGWSWPAARLGGGQSARDEALNISFNLSSVPTAVKARITLTRPDGSSTQVTCSSSPCTIVADARQGDHLLKVEYLTSTGSVLAAGSPTMAAVRH